MSGKLVKASLQGLVTRRNRDRAGTGKKVDLVNIGRDGAVVEGLDLRGTRTVLLKGPVADVKCQWNEPMARHTSFRIGGSAHALLFPQNRDSLAGLVGVLKKESLPYFVMGGGSNLLLPDDSVDAFVVKLSLCCSEIFFQNAPDRRKKSYIYVGAGVRLSHFLNFCLVNHLSGAEFLVGIPGTMGGAVVMNAGTRDGSISDILVWIEILDESGRTRRIHKSDLSPGYRSMGLPDDWVVVGACLKTVPDTRENIRIRLSRRMKIRKETQPLGIPSAGCIFKNPAGISAGALIERCGFKKVRIGDAEVSEKHANWILNRGNAKARDVLRLIELIETEVRRVFGIELERELRVLIP